MSVQTRRHHLATSIAEYYGISSIPTMILVDKQGKVISLEARGSKLVYLLRKHVGTVYESANSYAVAGQWDRVAAEMVRVLERRPDEIDTMVALGVAQSMAKDNEAYQKTCSIAFDKYGNLGPSSRYYLLKLCSIGPDCGIDQDVLTRLAKKEFGPVSKTRADLTIGMNHFRSGRFEDVIGALPADGDAYQRPASAFLRAMTHHKLGHKKESRELLRKGIEEADRQVPNAKGPRLEYPLAERWVVWSMLQLLRHEAESLIGAEAGTR